MSRKIIIMCVTLTLLGVLCAAEQILVHRITGDALAQTQIILQDIRGRRFDEASRHTKALDQMWDEQAKRLETLVDHSSTDDVRYALSRLLAALEETDAATAMVYACELEGGIEHVYERQALTLENIF
ncbi:MAG: DUF4363 family protein [Clostridia bacterium]|nr:DUF4363 family protein [Clostridia bacterium]